MAVNAKTVHAGKVSTIEHTRRTSPREPRPMLDARGVPASGERVGHVSPKTLRKR